MVRNILVGGSGVATGAQQDPRGGKCFFKFKKMIFCSSKNYNF